MPVTRPSLELSVEHGELVRKARELQAHLEGSDLQLAKKVIELNARDTEGQAGSDNEDEENKDPAIVAMDVAAQIVS